MQSDYSSASLALPLLPQESLWAGFAASCPELDQTETRLWHFLEGHRQLYWRNSGVSKAV